MSGQLARFGARLVRSTHLIDRAYQRFDRVRSLLVLAFASDNFFDAYNQLAYGSTPSYHADSTSFRSGLFAWEQQAIRDHFPPPPARVLVGGAGGGREAYALIELGYTVVAFDPAPGLAHSMREQAKAAYPASLRAFCAGYEDLPVMPATRDAGSTDLRTLGPFDASILGWSSFSHLNHDEARVAVLRQFNSLTRGPILVSYFSTEAEIQGERSRGILGRLRRRAFRRGSGMFAPAIGYVRLLSDADLRAMADRAGLDIVHLDRERAWPHAVLRSAER